MCRAPAQARVRHGAAPADGFGLRDPQPGAGAGWEERVGVLTAAGRRAQPGPQHPSGAIDLLTGRRKQPGGGGPFHARPRPAVVQHLSRCRSLILTA